MNPTLVVIDMQPAFSACKEALGPVLEEIRKAKKQRANIIIVEYDLTLFDGYNKRQRTTHKAVSKAVRRYPLKHLIKKQNDDGSPEIIQYCKKKNIQTDELRVCGVNTTICVMKTVRGLSNNRAVKKILVARNACADAYTNHDRAIKRLRMKKVKID